MIELKNRPPGFNDLSNINAEEENNLLDFLKKKGTCTASGAILRSRSAKSMLNNCIDVVSAFGTDRSQLITSHNCVVALLLLLSYFMLKQEENE